MTKQHINWRTASLPPKTAVFAIGDIHSQHQLLEPLLESIKHKIDQLPPGVQAHVVFIGDYVDRGDNAPKTINTLLKFEKDMAGKAAIKIAGNQPDNLMGWVRRILGVQEPLQTKPRVMTHFLCGNHDEYFKRLLEARGVTDKVLGKPDDPNDLRHYATDTDGTMTLMGLQAFFGGGVITTIKNYVPEAEIDKDLFVYDDKGHETGFNMKAENRALRLGKLVKALAAHVPQEHKDFFKRVYHNHHLILGDYLFTHAGVEPDKTLGAQGIDPNKTGKDQDIAPGVLERDGKSYLDTVMIRNPFLWRDDDNLPNCPYVVVHGHTPSEIKTGMDVIADGQKNYRLCVDTDVYHKGGALTCFVRQGDQATFMSVGLDDPSHAVREYSYTPERQKLAELEHTVRHPEYHRTSKLLAAEGDNAHVLRLLQQRGSPQAGEAKHYLKH